MARSNPYGHDEGESIEAMVDYDRDALGQTNLEAGEPEQRWSEYALELVPVLVDGEDSGQRAIMRNGEFLNMVSDQYKLIPNEEVVQTANEVANELGAVPFSEFSGDWYVKLDNHVFQDQDGRRAHALYAWDDPVDVGHGDEVQLGYAIHNSIDGSMGLQVSLFTFRTACANMVFMGVNGEGMSFDQRDVIMHNSRRHTAGLEMQNLKAWVESSIDFGPMIIDAYKEWQREALTPEKALEIVNYARGSRFSKRKDIPGWLQRAIETIEDAEEAAANNEQLGEQQYETLPHENKERIVQANIPAGETMWDAYNDISESVWHNDDTNDSSKMAKMRNLHRVFDPSPADAAVTIG